MERQRIIGLLVTISLALAGLVTIQVYWIRDTIALKDAQFSQSMDNALIAVSDRMERIEALRGIRSHSAGRRLLSRLDSLDHARDKDDDAGAGTEPSQWDMTIRDGAEERARLYAQDSIEQTIGNADLSDADREELVSDMVRGIMGAELFRDMADRVDPKLVDSLVTEELKARGIAAEHIQGVFDDKGIAMHGGLMVRSDSAALRLSPHRARLFRNDIIGSPWYLHLVIPEQQRLVLNAMTPLLAIAALFMLIIVLAFVHTIRTIWRQKRISDIKNDLVNNLTHELKTPISTIALACEALNDPSIPQSPEQMRSFVGMIRDENKRLGTLVESVLQSAVLDSGKMRIKPVDLDLHMILREVVRNTEMRANRNGGSMELREGAELAHVSGDRIHLTNVFHNLVDNALKYAQDGPRVRISTTSDATGITVSVQDNGIGIPKAEQKKIFDRLYRVPTGNLHNVKGFGLGLSYVKAVVERHHGSIRVESEPGQGSTFHITLPFEHARNDQASAR